MIQQFALSLRHTYSWWKTYLWATCVGAAFLLLVGGSISNSKTLLGIPGSGACLIVIVAAILAGPWVGATVGLSLGVVFYGVVADFGSVGLVFGTAVGTAIWVLAALAAGYLAVVMRSATGERDELREQRRLYQLLESGLLPTRPFKHPGIEVATRYIPSEQRLRLGGDFLDVRSVSENEVAFIVGDVAGHGPEAAALGATMRAVWHGLILSHTSPEKVVDALNQVVCADAEEDYPFVTAVFGWVDVDRGRLTYLSAGHPPLLLIGDDATELRDVPHLPLGVEPDMKPELHSLAVERPVTLFAYTDGLVDAPAPHKSGLAPDQWLLQRMGGLRGRLSEQALDDLIAEALGPGLDARDDIAVLALRLPCPERPLAVVADKSLVGSRQRES